MRERRVSETDSFIEEVTEEVRRDQLFGYFRRYGWIAIAVVVLIVAGAAYNEYRKSQERAQAQALGDSILVALEADNSAEELAKIEDAGSASPILALLQSAIALEEDDPAGAASALQAIMDNADAPSVYRDMAVLKHSILTAGETSADERISTLSQLTAAGAPFRVLAEEQIALAEVENGDKEAAIARLHSILDDTETSQGLRRRASQLIVALGGDVNPG